MWWNLAHETNLGRTWKKKRDEEVRLLALIIDAGFAMVHMTYLAVV